MFSLTHSLTGAFVASKTQNPFFYVPITLFLHFFEDWIPHWDLGTGLSKRKNKQTALYWEFVDLALTFGLIYLLWQKGSQKLEVDIWAGALVGILPDLVEAPANFLNLDFEFLKPVNRFHYSVHQSLPHVVIGLLPQIAIVGLILILK